MRQSSKPRFLLTLSVTGKLFLVIALVVTLTLTVLGALDYWNEARTLGAFHQFVMEHRAADSSNTQAHEQHLALIREALTRTQAAHLLHWGATVAVLVLALHCAVEKIVLRPIRRIMAGLHAVELGTWTPRVAVTSADELGQLAQKIDHVGSVLSLRVGEWRGVERLSALALVSKWVGKEIRQCTKEIRAVARDLELEPGVKHSAQDSSVKTLKAVAARLEAVETSLGEQFAESLETVRNERRQGGRC